VVKHASRQSVGRVVDRLDRAVEAVDQRAPPRPVRRLPSRQIAIIGQHVAQQRLALRSIRARIRRRAVRYPPVATVAPCARARCSATSGVSVAGLEARRRCPANQRRSRLAAAGVSSGVVPQRDQVHDAEAARCARSSSSRAAPQSGPAAAPARVVQLGDLHRRPSPETLATIPPGVRRDRSRRSRIRPAASAIRRPTQPRASSSLESMPLYSCFTCGPLESPRA